MLRKKTMREIFKMQKKTAENQNGEQTVHDYINSNIKK